MHYLTFSGTKLINYYYCYYLMTIQLNTLCIMFFINKNKTRFTSLKFIGTKSTGNLK